MRTTPVLGDSTLAKIRPFTAADMVALAAAAAMVVVFALLRRPEPAERLLAPLGITVAFALLAWYTRGVNWSGAVAGSAISFILAGRDIRIFCVLLIVFGLTLVATRIGADRKRQLRTAEADDGRTAAQVMANLGVAGFVAALAPPGWVGWPLLVLAALAEAAADTSSSEIGMAFPGKTVLITTWKPVAPGIDGGISARGTAAAVVAAVVVAFTGRALGVVSQNHTFAVVYAGFLATLVDSLLGALVERRGWLNNDLVNLLSTGAAAGIAWLLM
jgi:uncharacterized protein (TIGR00297 family)